MNGRVVLTNLGAYSDVSPFGAIGRELRKRGYQAGSFARPDIAARLVRPCAARALPRLLYNAGDEVRARP